MQSLSLEEISKPASLKKKKKTNYMHLSCAELALRVVKVKVKFMTLNSR